MWVVPTLLCGVEWDGGSGRQWSRSEEQLVSVSGATGGSFTLSLKVIRANCV